MLTPPRVSQLSLPCTSTTAVAFDLRRPQTTCISASYSGNLPKTFFIVTLSLINRCLRILFRTLNHQYDYTFDWTMLKQKAAASAAVGGTVAPVAPPAMPGPRWGGGGSHHHCHRHRHCYHQRHHHCYPTSYAFFFIVVLRVRKGSSSTVSE